VHQAPQRRGQETGQQRDMASAPRGGTGQGKGLLRCAPSAGHGWILHSPTQFPRLRDQNAKQRCETRQGECPESFTGHRPPLKEEISRYHPTASPEGADPNHFNRSQSNLFSELLPCRFSHQPGFHFATSLKAQTFSLPPKFKSSPHVFLHLTVGTENTQLSRL